MYSVLSSGPLWASAMGPFELIFDSITYCSLSQGIKCFVLSGFRNSPLISIHIIIQVSLVLYFSKYIRLRQSYEFPFIFRDLRQIYQCVSRQLRAKSKTGAIIGRWKFIECVVGKKFLQKTVCRNVKKCRFYIYICMYMCVFIYIYICVFNFHLIDTHFELLWL